MKKIFGCLFLFLTVAIHTAFAGDAPEALLSEDTAKLFFGEVISCESTEAETSIVVSPVKKIKGNITLGEEQTYDKVHPVGEFSLQQGKIYLFTDLDGNHTVNVFDVTSHDTATLQIKHTDFDIWKRLEAYLNEGAYETAEQKRIDKQKKQNALQTEVGERISLSALLEAERDSCDKLMFCLQDGGSYEIDREAFFSLADTVMLKDIDNRLAGNKNSFFILAYAGNDVHTVSMWDGCLVSGSRVASQSAPTGDYVIRTADFEKLVALFPENARSELPEHWLQRDSATKYVIDGFLLVLLVGIAGFFLGYRRGERKKHQKKTEKM